MRGVYIIAEVGVNHNGSMDLAKKLIDEASVAGADCVKFQTFNPEELVTEDAVKADYQKKATGSRESQLEMLQKLSLSKEDFRELKEYCSQKKIDFLSTPFDLDSIDFLDALGCDIWKIPSGEITNYPYLVRIAKTGKDIILSTGMADLDEVGAAIRLLKENGCGDVTLLHCTTEYPAPVQDVNLKAMLTMGREFSCRFGYSDHTKGLEIPVAAVALGAQVIEKHFTLDRNMKGPDHKASLEPCELKSMVDAVRNVEKAMGNGVKAPSESEKVNIPIARKSIVARKSIQKGETLTEENLTTKRPGTGISPMKWPDVIGAKAIRDFRKDEMIEE